MAHKLKITREKIISDLKTLISNHNKNKVDLNPSDPDFMSKYESEIKIKDYFFYTTTDKVFLELHEYENNTFGFYFGYENSINKKTYQPIFKCDNPKEVLNPKVINDIYTFLKNHIKFMNTLGIIK